MSYIRRKGIWRPQQVPTFPVEIDYAHPLANGLAYCILPAAGYPAVDLVRNATLAGVSSPVVAGGSPGPGIKFDGSASYASENGGPYLRTDFQVSIFGLFSCPTPTSGSDHVVFGLNSKSSNNPFFTFDSVSLHYPNLRVWVRDGNGRGPTIVYTTATPFDGNVHSCELLYDGTTLRSYVDGVADATTPFATTATTTFDSVGIGARSSTGNLFAQCTVFLALAYNRPRSPAEAEWSAAEPFAMLRPKVRRRFYVVPSGGGSAAVNASLSETLPAITASSAGSVIVSAAAAPQVGAVSSSAAASVTASASASATLGAVSAAADAQAIVSASASLSLGAVTPAASGAAEVAASAAASVGNLTLSAAATIGNVVNATVDATMGAVTASAAGEVLAQAAASPTLSAITSSASATVQVSAAVAASIADLSLSAQAEHGGASAEVSAQIGAITASAQAAVTVSAEAAPTMGQIQAVISGAPVVSASLSKSIGEMTCAAAMVTGNTFIGVHLVSETLSAASIASETMTSPSITSESLE